MGRELGKSTLSNHSLEHLAGGAGPGMLWLGQETTGIPGSGTIHSKGRTPAAPCLHLWRKYKWLDRQDSLAAALCEHKQAGSSQP